MSMKLLASLPSRSTGLIVSMAALLTLLGTTAAAAAPTAAQTGALKWHTFTLINGWQSASKTLLVTGTPAWALHNGVVYLRGAIKQSTPGGSATFAELPAYARPAHNLYIQVYTSSDVPGILYVGAGGTLEAYDGNAVTFTSLAAVSYPTSAVKSHKLALKNGWTSSQPSYATGDPSYAISGGVVYLSGSLNGGSSKLAATLPKAARPAHQMFVSVYTFDGATGWLQILPDGQVEIFGTGARAYTSLANISYPVAATKWHNFKLEDGWTSGRVKFHTADPSYAIISGVVYLSGSMFDAKGKIGLWADLPAGVRTAADVLEIETGTAKGTAGGLAVTDTFGLVSSMPFTNAKQFTSLAAIAYPQSS